MADLADALRIRVKSQGISCESPERRFRNLPLYLGLLNIAKPPNWTGSCSSVITEIAAHLLLGPSSP